jgi:hypothetical protein
MKTRKMSMAEAQTAANEYARKYLSNTPLGIPSDLEPEKFKALMDGVMRAIVEAWAAGFMAAR